MKCQRSPSQRAVNGSLKLCCKSSYEKKFKNQFQVEMQLHCRIAPAEDPEPLDGSGNSFPIGRRNCTKI